MGNPFQDQLLKAGLVNKKQVQKANQEKARKNKKQKNNKKIASDTVDLNINQATQDKAAHDRALNKKKDEQARSKATSIEINQLISNNCITRDDSCDIVYNFEHRKKINRIHINAEMKQQIILGKLGIARIEGRYELVPCAIAEKIKQRNEKRIILLDKEDNEVKTDDNDPYANYQIPDDLTW